MRSKDNFDEYGKFKKTDWTKQNTPVHWLKNNPILTYIGNIYIIATVEVERFTIKVVKPLITLINDKTFSNEVDIFVKEEIAHAYHHTATSNDLLRHHYPVKFVTKCVRFFYSTCSKLMPLKSQLALVLAFEFVAHELSIGALKIDLFPKNKLAIFDFLWWHAIEEVAHCDLCIKLYKHFGGGYFRRISVLCLVMFFCLIYMTLFPILFFVTDKYHGRKIKFKHLSSAVSFFIGVDGIIWKHIKPYLRFFLTNFSPRNFNFPKKKTLS